MFALCPGSERSKPLPGLPRPSVDCSAPRPSLASPSVFFYVVSFQHAAAAPPTSLIRWCAESGIYGLSFRRSACAFALGARCNGIPFKLFGLIFPLVRL